MATMMRIHSPAAPKAAFTRLAITESKLFLREPLALFFGVAFPLVLLVIVGSIPSSQQADKTLGGLRFVDVYVPVLLAFVLAMLALSALPVILASYREKGILRRLSTTPVPPSWVLAAQLAINFVVAVTAMILIVGIGRLVFDVALPRQLIGFVLAVLLAAAALLALGLFVAAIAPNGRAANGIGVMLFFPLMFFAGLWVPREQMPDTLRHVGDFSPLGAAVQALQDTTQGHWPHLQALVVMGAYAIVFGVAAVRLFRWQ